MVWGPETCWCILLGPPHPPLLPRALGVVQTLCSSPACSKEGKRKAFFFGPFSSCLGIQSHGLGSALEGWCFMAEP